MSAGRILGTDGRKRAKRARAQPASVLLAKSFASIREAGTNGARNAAVLDAGNRYTGTAPTDFFKQIRKLSHDVGAALSRIYVTEPALNRVLSHDPREDCDQ